jgi:hypothetical protein
VEWILHTLTLKYLSEKNKISVTTLWTRFKPFLTKSLTGENYFLRLKKEKNNTLKFSGFLLIDGDWFGKENLILYKDSKAGVLFWRFSKGEYKQEIKDDILFLKSNGYHLKGTIVDGKNSLVNASKEHEVPVQRCLVHIQKGIRKIITRKPKNLASKELKEWSLFLNKIHNNYEAKILIRWFIRLYRRHEYCIKERSEKFNFRTNKKKWWYTHKKTRTAYRLVINGFGEMFTFLRYENMPKDTNGIEGFFSQLDTKISRHRGLIQSKKESLISWFLYLSQFPKTTFKNTKY